MMPDTTDEEQRLQWALNELRAATRLLAEEAEEQLSYLTQAALGIGYEQLPVDELALQFGDTAVHINQLVRAGLVSEQDARQLKAIDDMLSANSGRHNAHLWTPEALRASQEWQDIRTRAARIRGFGDADVYYFHVARGKPGVSVQLAGPASFGRFVTYAREFEEPELLTVTGPHGRSLTVGVGSSESVLGWQETENPPYSARKGRVDADEPVAFFFWGEHWTEFPRSQVIESGVAFEAVKIFLATATRPENVEWAEV